jgi:hypothetical protein
MCLWHLPSVVLLPLLTGTGNIPQAAVSLVGLTLGAVGYTIVLTWLYNNTGSLFWIVVLHGYANRQALRPARGTGAQHKRRWRRVYLLLPTRSVWNSICRNFPSPGRSPGAR